MEKYKLFLKKNGLLLFAIAYFLLPTDLIPDLLPILGKTDDFIFLLLEVIKRINEFKKNEKV